MYNVKILSTNGETMAIFDKTTIPEHNFLSDLYGKYLCGIGKHEIVLDKHQLFLYGLEGHCKRCGAHLITTDGERWM